MSNSIRLPIHLRGITLIALSILLCWLTFRNNTPETTFFANDQATDFIIARLHERGEDVLLGPPSHVGGRHPGPLYYRYVAFFASLADFDFYRASILFSLTKLFGVCILAYLCALLAPTGYRAAAIAGLLFVMCTEHYLEIIRMPWQSNFLLLAGSIALLSAMLTIRYGPPFFFVLLLGLSVLFHSHLSSVPVVAGIGVAVLLSFYFRWKEWTPIHSRNTKRTLVILPLVVLVWLWMPVIQFELGYPSNFGRLFSLHVQDEIRHAGFYLAFKTLIRFISKLTIGFEIQRDTLSILPVLFLVSGVILFLRYIRSESSEKLWYVAALITPLLLTTIALARFREPLHVHYLNSSVCIPALLFAAIFAHGIFEIRKRELLSLSGLSSSVPALLFLSTTLLLTGSSILESFQRYNRNPHYEFMTLKHARELSAIVLEDSGGKPENLRLFARMFSARSVNAYYYFLDGPHHRYMEYRRFFTELPAFERRDTALPDNAYVVMCPNPYSRERRGFLNEFKRHWEVTGTLDLSSCETCDRCHVTKMVRKKKAQ